MSDDAATTDLLRLPVAALADVTPAAAQWLAGAGIDTIHDLAGSWLFGTAEAASTTYPPPAGDLLSCATAAHNHADGGEAPLECLRSLAGIDVAALRSALGVTTVGQLAAWPPRRAAAVLAAKAFDTPSVSDPANALRPEMGTYATEHAYFSTLAMLGLTDSSATGVQLDRPISLNPTVDGELGFRSPAVGAVITVEQAWYAKGVTLGQMLHSLALAPGEATRIAITDWSRRTAATTTEDVTEAETLDNRSLHTRAISEVQNAVADEMQRGQSLTSGWATASSTSDAESGGSGLGGYISGNSASSHTEQSAESAYGARTTSWTLGRRSVTASMTQNVNDRTEQHATSVRNRRASAVREVSQSEHENVSTRIVANYNHMHALTVQYYEVVQIYDVRARLVKAERCLFVPIDLPSFRGPAAGGIVDRFRGALMTAALTPRVRDLLSGPARILVVPRAAPHRHLFDPESGAAAPPAAVAVRVAKGEAPDSTPERIISGSVSFAGLGKIGTVLHLPLDAKLVGIAYDGPDLIEIRLGVAGQSPITCAVGYGRVDVADPIPFDTLDTISVTRESNATNAVAVFTLEYVVRGRRMSASPMTILLGKGMKSRTVADVRTDQEDRDRELLAHLQANAAYYGQAILSSLDPTTLALILQPFTWNGRSVLDQIEPAPIAVVSNYLVFRAPAEESDPSGLPGQTWGELLDDRGVVEAARQEDRRQIAVPTGGVFAEAVLGRSNSAEKLDITRFWNWQDSPIPMTPPDIAPIQTGSRQSEENLTVGQLGAPVITVTAPIGVPDPSGTGAILQALATGTLFRDMSAASGTQQVAGVGMQGVIGAQEAAATAASTNLQAEIQRSIAQAQLAADVGKAAMGIPPTSSGKVEGISGDGARINHGRDMDERGVSSPMPAAGLSGTSAPTEPSGTVGGHAGSPQKDSAQEKPAQPGPRKEARERRYADQAAHNYSPDAVGDVIAAGQGNIVDMEETILPPAGQDLGNESLAITAVNEYIHSSIATLSNGYSRAFDHFAVWYGAYKYRSESSTHAIWENVLKESFSQFFTLIFPEGGVLVKIMKAAGEKILDLSLVKLEETSEDVNALLNMYRLHLSSYVNSFGSGAEAFATQAPDVYDMAIEYYITDVNDPNINLGQAFGLPPRVLTILDDAGFIHPTDDARDIVEVKILTAMILAITKQTLINGRSWGEWAGVDERVYAEDEALAAINVDRYMDRICELERLMGPPYKYCRG